MDTRLFSLVQEQSPKFNETIVNGLACKDIPHAQAYIERIIRCAEQQYPPGLEFVGSKVCGPLEEYNVITQVRGGGKRVFDLARSDVYLVKYQFRYNGDDLEPRYLYLPYVRPGGLIYIMGKQFAISPVLADKVFSVGIDDVFIPMPRGKVTFNSTMHYYEVGEYRYPDNPDAERVSKSVVWSTLHNRDAKKNKNSRSDLIHLSRVYCTLMHYLLCKHPFDYVFSHYGKAEVKVVDETDATHANFPADEWVICRSTKIKPKGVRKRGDYFSRASTLALVVRKKDYTPLVQSMVAGVFYVIDHFPDACYMSLDDVHSMWQWQVLMGYILFGEDPSEGKLVEDVSAHIRSLDGYVDFEVQKTLREEEIDCKDIYDLFVYILSRFDAMIIKSSGKLSSMYDKQLMVLRYVLSDINNEIFNFLFKITNNNKKQMTKEEIGKILHDHFKPKLILRINGGKGHGEISSVSSPSDNKFFKITSVIVQQNDTAGKGKGRETKPIGPDMYLDASIAEFGGYCVLPKSSPIGKDRASPYGQLGAFNRLERNPKFIELLDSTQEKFNR